ncbi:hypothetical protein GQX74_002403 [Glossina fuscipes]|nr:hypothetical protein GQX74_002403 [Glossina fuscipes]
MKLKANRQLMEHSRAHTRRPLTLIVLLGDSATGKSSHTKRYLTSVWDTAGEEEFGGLRDSYCIHAECAIIMFDITSCMTYINYPAWYADLRRVCDSIPVVLCANRVDLQDRRIENKNICLPGDNNTRYFATSSRLNYNLEKPFLWMAQKLLGDINVKFATCLLCSSASYSSSQVKMDKTWRLKLETQSKKNDEETTLPEKGGGKWE